MSIVSAAGKIGSTAFDLVAARRGGRPTRPGLRGSLLWSTSVHRTGPDETYGPTGGRKPDNSQAPAASSLAPWWPFGVPG